MKKALYILIFLLSMSICNKISAYTEYKVGDVVPYNGMDFYVIKDSSSEEDSVTMLKAEPLTVEEVNRYGTGHVNMYNCIEEDTSCYHTAYNSYGYGGMAYYTSKTCGYVNGSYVDTGCTTDYEASEVKYVVDAWKAVQAPAATEARLISKKEIDDNFEFEEYDISCGGCGAKVKRISKAGMYNSNYGYWTMSAWNDLASAVWVVGSDGSLSYNSDNDSYRVVRPVITLSKTVLGDVDESIVEDNETVDDKNVKGPNETKVDTKENVEDKTNESKSTVKVDNTYMSSSILLIILGFITASISVSIIYKLSNKKR